MSDDTDEQKPPPEPSPPASMRGGRVSDDEQDDSEDNAGFEFKVPGFRAWGGRTELRMLMPVLKWGIVGALAIWGAAEIMRTQ